MTELLLPHHDRAGATRAAKIQRQRSIYRWDHEYLPPLPMLAEGAIGGSNLFQAFLGWMLGDLPWAERPHFRYLWGRFKASWPLFANQLVTDDVWSQDGFADLSQPERLFTLVPEPASVLPWREDRWFGWQRVAGMNPVAIERLDTVPKGFDVSRVVLPAGETFEGLAASGALFGIDYVLLDGIWTQPWLEGRKHCPPVRVLLRATGAGELLPLAIELDESAGAAGVYVPGDGDAWQIAKMVAQSADLNVHEISTHLCRTHFVLEGFVVALARTLSPRHPIAALLAHHLRFTIFNNYEGRQLLVSPDGFATQLLVGGVQGTKQLLARSYSGYTSASGRHSRPWSLAMWDLPRELALRGFAPTGGTLREYPYRDDGMLLWSALDEFVRAYVAAYYPSDAELLGDREIQDFARELASPAGAHVPGLPGQPGVFATTDELVEVVRNVIFGASVYHSAVNFPQYDGAAFMPNMPGAIYAPVPPDLRAMSPEARHSYLLRAMLPPPDKTRLQLFTVHLLTSYRDRRLGDYEGRFAATKAHSAVELFRSQLAAAGATIDARNVPSGARPWPYRYLHPELVLNAANI
jgi:arachidonate 15-lipoxygenase